MKKMSALILALVFIFSGTTQAQEQRTTTLNAKQVSKLDVSGKWVGKRKQYSWDQKSYIEVFEYEFDLKQEGDIISGTTTIINSNGEYADMQIEGVLVGNKLHFAEKEIKSAIRPEGKVWCFKSGELFFEKNGDQLVMFGKTPSYMEVYNYPCSGGFTYLTKADNSSNSASLKSDFDNVNIEEKMNVSVFPNPFIENATVYYTLTEDAKVKVELYDMSGKMVTQLFEGNQKAGSYNNTFNGKSFGGSGMLIVKLTVNGEVFSRQIVQMK
jgi:hypothetical protein